MPVGLERESMFGVAGDGCPPRFRMARDDEMRIVVDVLHRRGVLCTVPELFMLGSDRCRVALCADETPPAVLIEPTAPKVTLAVHGRAGSPALRQYLLEVEAGIGFMVAPELEPMVVSTRRNPRVLSMRVLSSSRARPGLRPEPAGVREVLAPRHEDALSRLSAEGRGFLECYHSLNEFLSSAITGVASVVDGEIVSICVVYARAGDVCEVAAYTRPEHRGQGHALAACIPCIERIVAARCRPAWTAVDEASWRLGIKAGLGPVGEKLYVMFEHPAA